MTGSYTTEKVMTNHGYTSNIFPSFGRDTILDTLLPGSHVIFDWVTSSSRKQRDNTDVEPDFGASVDQFFECFDELRTSHIADVTLLLSFVDEDPEYLDNQTNARPYVRYLGAKFHNTLFILQVCPRDMNIKATVEHFELSDHFSSGNNIEDSDLKGYNDDIKTQVTSIGKLQTAVEASV
ncbi:hypothetical protein POM88_001657 [Heracleum sosnowskyi]|uniref:Uncharacterized protein n=1 Tax=Heracleum sosnowskyi TaxID=360622 RepID=A0AAD8JCZ1_9APIA|nr:hypothetical protein POM88_001657 [Heracleum sosnowskyi]